ncbi:NADH-quinone oxidoreductase subunit L [Babesia caballi]|uniref:NADH-quinone oxidoreductase subunit L n=1 Tax=Babesia caballi TaxID=5871 RepID=A0AAV4M0G3_BABCB|nr:NADH-quinone oxidoreductase subunit L [Babesia caballi]
MVPADAGARRRLPSRPRHDLGEGRQVGGRYGLLREDEGVQAASRKRDAIRLVYDDAPDADVVLAVGVLYVLQEAHYALELELLHLRGEQVQQPQRDRQYARQSVVQHVVPECHHGPQREDDHEHGKKPAHMEKLLASPTTGGGTRRLRFPRSENADAGLATCPRSAPRRLQQGCITPRTRTHPECTSGSAGSLAGRTRPVQTLS